VSPLLFRGLSDETLGRRLANGEAAAFDELYRRYVHRLAAYGAHLLGDAAAGDDVAQAALLKAYGALREGRIPDHVRPWLFRVAHNAALDLVVRRRELPAANLPERLVEDTGEGGALVAALAQLPDRQRRVYALRELHGLRIDETAAELDLTSAQVEQALFAARNRLAELLVFGERLSCVSVRRLAAGPLDGTERRALRTHLHSCPACRSVLGVRAKALTWLPLPSLEWLRGLAGIGGAPAAAKIGAGVATATVAAGVGVPVAMQQVRRPSAHHPRAVRPEAVKRHPAVGIRPAASVPVSEMSSVAPGGARMSVSVAVRDDHGDKAAPEHRDRERDARTGSNDGPSGDDGGGASTEAQSIEVPSHGDGGHEGPSGGSATATAGESHDDGESGHGGTPTVTTGVLTTAVESGASGSGSDSRDGGEPKTTTTTTSSDSGDGGAVSGDSGGSGDSGDSTPK
jgi:RNA polymerase sigma factor (sigma-70 family)